MLIALITINYFYEMASLAYVNRLCDLNNLFHLLKHKYFYCEVIFMNLVAQNNY